MRVEPPFSHGAPLADPERADGSHCPWLSLSLQPADPVDGIPSFFGSLRRRCCGERWDPPFAPERNFDAGPFPLILTGLAVAVCFSGQVCGNIGAEGPVFLWWGSGCQPLGHRWAFRCRRPWLVLVLLLAGWIAGGLFAVESRPWLKTQFQVDEVVTHPAAQFLSFFSGLAISWKAPLKDPLALGLGPQGRAPCGMLPLLPRLIPPQSSPRPV
jgi:hypothetical protein